MRAIIKLILAAVAIIALYKIGAFSAVILFITMGIVPFTNYELDPIVMLAIQGALLVIIGVWIGFGVALSMQRVKHHQPSRIKPEPIKTRRQTIASAKPKSNPKKRLKRAAKQYASFASIWRYKLKCLGIFFLTRVKLASTEIYKFISKLSKQLKSQAITARPYVKRSIQKARATSIRLVKKFYQTSERIWAWFRSN